jgi:PIN domain nuclease of toxin-antitoxin system
VNLLLDTHVLLWAAGSPEKLSAASLDLITDTENTLVFSAASIWEVAIKSRLGRTDFDADAHLLRRGLLDNGYLELPVSGAHAAAVQDLPSIHRDPFDRMLMAQAATEGLLLLTGDEEILKYPGPVRRV